MRVRVAKSSAAQEEGKIFNWVWFVSSRAKRISQALIKPAVFNIGITVRGIFARTVVWKYSTSCAPRECFKHSQMSGGRS